METIRVRDFVQPDSPDTAREINRLLAGHPKEARFELGGGEWHLDYRRALRRKLSLSNCDPAPVRQIGLLLERMTDVQLDGGGARLICHGPLIPLALLGCRNVRVSNITVNWAIPMSAEGRIVDNHGDFIDVFIDTALFPCKVVNRRLTFVGEDWEEPLWDWGNNEFDSNTRTLTLMGGDRFRSDAQEALGEGLFRFYGDFRGQARPGNLLALRHTLRRHSGLFGEDCTRLVFDNITFHSTAGLGALMQFCEGLYFRKLQFYPDTSRGRMLVSGHDDGIHLSNNRGEVTVEDCAFHGLMDDAINIHGTCVRVIESTDIHTLRCRYMHPQAAGFPHWARYGDRISLIDHTTMEGIAALTAVSYQLLHREEFLITFREPVPKRLKAGDALENLSNTASFACRRNIFGGGRARSLLISTPQPVVVEENIFDSSGSAILLAGDANYWYESGACRDVSIRRNVFNDCCLSSYYQFGEAVVTVYPEVPMPEQAPPFHRNIRVEDNLFYTADYPVLYARCTESLSFQRNTIARSRRHEPWHPRRHMITAAWCRKVTVHNNCLLGDVLGADVAAEHMPPEEIDADLSVICAKTEEGEEKYDGSCLSNDKNRC